jgi:hypothetical protein
MPLSDERLCRHKHKEPLQSAGANSGALHSEALSSPVRQQKAFLKTSHGKRARRRHQAPGHLLKPPGLGAPTS